MFPKSAIRRLLGKLDIIDVVRHYLKQGIVRRGKNPHEWIASCPFHSERTPSFTVTTQKQFYHCFGCGAHGNAIRFVAEMEGIGYPEAVLRVSRLTGIRIAADKTNPARARQRSRAKVRAVRAERNADIERERKSRRWIVEREKRYRESLRKEKERRAKNGLRPIALSGALY